MLINMNHSVIETKDGGNPASNGSNDQKAAASGDAGAADKKSAAQPSESLDSIKQAVSAIEKTCAALRAEGDKKQAQLDKKGGADAVTQAQIDKLNDEIDRLQAKQEEITKAQTKANRTATSQGGEQKASNPAEQEHKDAFLAYARKGNAALFEAMEEKSLSVISDPDGGYLVTPAMSGEIIKIIRETSPIRSVAAVQTIGTDSLEFINDINNAGGGWVGEETARPETTTPQIGKQSIQVHELYAQPKATQKLLDDSSINIEQWLAENVAETFRVLENTAFVSGNGVGQPRGFLTYTAGTSWGQVEQINSGSSGAVTADAFIKLFYGLKEAYALRSSFLMQRTVIRDARLLKDQDDRYIWAPDLQGGGTDTILGRPVVQAEDMPAASANSLSVAIADWQKAYQIVDRIGIRTLRDPFTEKPFVKFYTTKRVGGAVKNFEAIKLMKLAS